MCYSALLAWFDKKLSIHLYRLWLELRGELPLFTYLPRTAHSRKLAYTRSALLSPPGALGYRVRDHPGYLGRSLAAGVAIKRYELLRLATREFSPYSKRSHGPWTIQVEY